MVSTEDAVKRILIIDDNADVADALGVWLKISGHEVTIARTAEQALAIAPTAKPDVILLDIGLPDLDGFSLARELRKIPNIPKFLIAAVTGYGFGNPLSEEHLKDLEIDYYFLKPMGAQNLKTLGINI